MKRDDFNERRLTLLSFVNELLTSAKRKGKSNVSLSDEIIKKVDEIANSSLNFSDLKTFDKIKLTLEKIVQNQN